MYVTRPNQPSLEEVVDRFRSDLDQLNGAQPMVLPSMAHEINHDAMFMRVLPDMAQGIYLDPGNDSRQGLYRPDVRFEFREKRDNRLTREDSHNVVFFGPLFVLPQEQGVESYAQGSVKSREMTHKAQLIGETALFQHLDALGLKTFHPAALLIGKEAVHLMTYFESSVATMDTVEWKETTPDEAWAELGKAVDTFYSLHTNMLFHGDLEFRNVAFDHTGDTVIIDPELMISAKDDFELLSGAGMELTAEQATALDKLARKMSIEFTAVCKSVSEQIIPLLPRSERPRNDAARLKLYKKHLFEPYKSRLRDADEPVKSVLLRVYDAMMLKKKQNAAEERL